MVRRKANDTGSNPDGCIGSQSYASSKYMIARHWERLGCGHGASAQWSPHFYNYNGKQIKQKGRRKMNEWIIALIWFVGIMTLWLGNLWIIYRIFKKNVANL